MLPQDVEEEALARVAEVRDRRGVDLSGRDGVWIRFKSGERLSGVPPHAGDVSLTVVNKIVGTGRADIAVGHFERMRELCLGAFFDGYVFASVLAGPVADPKLFTRGADASRFAGRVADRGEALLAGPLAAAAQRILDAWRPHLPEDAPPLLPNAVAAGILLRRHEGAQHPWFESLAPPAAQRKAPEPPARHASSPEMLDAILAAPDDDEVRLVYADWLAEKGDPLGEMIHVQLALGGAIIGAGAGHRRAGLKMATRPRLELEQRERELVKRHEKTWLAPFRRHIRRWTWRRGFVDHVEADVGAFVDGHEALARVPLGSAELTGFKPPLVEKLRAAPAHPTMRRVLLAQNRIGPRQAVALTGPFFARTTVLDLWSNPLGEGVERLAEAPFPALERLRLESVDATTRSVCALAKAPWWGRLTHLSLAWNRQLDSGALDALADARSLSHLSLSNTSLTSADADVLLERLPGLRWLKIADSEFTDEPQPYSDRQAFAVQAR
jgi:uncharacterized protein (TIGR02996 family)